MNTPVVVSPSASGEWTSTKPFAVAASVVVGHRVHIREAAHLSAERVVDGDAELLAVADVAHPLDGEQVPRYAHAALSGRARVSGGRAVVVVTAATPPGVSPPVAVNMAIDSTGPPAT